MGRDGVKAWRIYIKLYMSIFIGKNFSYPLKIFLSGALYFQLPKDFVICFGVHMRYCFEGALALLLGEHWRYCCWVLQGLPAVVYLFCIWGGGFRRGGCGCGSLGAAWVRVAGRRRSWPSAVGWGLPGVSCGWSEAIHIRVRAPTIIYGKFETSSCFAYASLLLINTLPFTCGERKICSTIKKSQNIMNIIIRKIFFYLLCLYYQLSL